MLVLQNKIKKDAILSFLDLIQLSEDNSSLTVLPFDIEQHPDYSNILFVFINPDNTNDLGLPVPSGVVFDISSYVGYYISFYYSDLG